MVLSNTDNIDVFSVTEWDHFQMAYDALRTGEFVSPNANVKYDWVAIDSITAAQELAKRKALMERGLDAGPSQISQNDWGKIGSLMSELFYRYKTLPVHVLFTAQERLRETGDVYEYQPAVSPMSLEALHPSQFLIGRLYVTEVQRDGVTVAERRLRVGPADRFMTKVRAVPGRSLPAILREPNLRQIFGYLLGADGYEQPEGVEPEALGNPFIVAKE